MGLGIHPAHQLAPAQQRQHEVTVLALGGRGVALDAIIKAKEFAGPLAIPHQGIEGREHGCVGRLETASLGPGQLIGERCVHEGAVLPALHPHRQQLPLVRQLMEQGVVFAAPQAVVIRHPAGLDQPQRPAAGAHHVPLGELRARQIPPVVPLGHDPLGEIVDPLEVAPLAHHQAPCGEQHLQVALLGLPVPPAVALALLAFEVGGPHRALPADALDYLRYLAAVGLEPLGGELPAHGGGIQHAMAQQPVILARDEAGLVGPVFEEIALGQQLLQPARIVVAEPAEQHQIGAAGHHRDGVYLQQRHAPYAGQQIGGRSLGAARGQQPLGCELQVAGVLQ
ncbi:hypothetical protein D3C85_838510 [compost metagenome]